MSDHGPTRSLYKVRGLPVVPALEQQQSQEDLNSKTILSYKVNSRLVLAK